MMRINKKYLNLAVLALLGVTLSGCRGDASSYSQDASSTDKAITIVRDQAWPWSNWEVSVVITNAPDCARRYLMTTTSTEGTFKLDLYRSYEGGYIMSLRKKWYVTDFTKCQFQTYKEPPAEPGDLLGTFRVKNGDFTFVANKDAVAAAQAAPPVQAAATEMVPAAVAAPENTPAGSAGDAAAAMAR